MKTGLFVSSLVIALLPLCGCPVAAPPAAEAVLQGTWKLTGDVVAPGVTDFLVTFDARGKISALSYRYNNIILVDLNDPAFIQSDSTVSGSDVSIVATWLSVNNLVFDGTLNAGQTQMTGTMSYRLLIGNITVDAPAGNAQLTKQ